MEIVIHGSSKEIADLVFELQGRQEKEPMPDGQVITDPDCIERIELSSGKYVNVYGKK